MSRTGLREVCLVLNEIGKVGSGSNDRVVLRLVVRVYGVVSDVMSFDFWLDFLGFPHAVSL